MATIREALKVAIQHHQGGRLIDAERIYRQILQADPNHADAIQLLGVIAHQVGKHELAVEYIERAIGLNATNPAFQNNLGEAYRALQRIPEAVSYYKRALALKPDYAEAHNNLGIALSDQGNLDDAVACYHQALKLKPDYVEAHNNLGNALNDQGNIDNAVACYDRALELKPDYAEAHNNLGNALSDQGNLDDAVACYHRALELKPDYAEAHYNLGNALNEQGNLDDAIACYRRVLALKSDFVRAHNNLGNALKDQGQSHEAVACYHRALELKPDLPETHNNLGNAFKEQGKLDEAIASYHRALELKPDLPETHNNLGCALKDQGKLDEAVACYRRALDLKPDYTEAHDNLLLALHYFADVTLAALAAAHAEYDCRHAAPLRPSVTQHAHSPDREDQVRLGFISADLGRHPVGYFMVGVLENLNKTKHDAVCYSDRIVKDDLTQRLQTAATEWHDVMGLSDERLAERIRTDRIDILFDLAGHTGRNRLLVFARKPAPLQVTWAGYAGTTGLTAMDYLLADRYEVPAGAERHFQERVLRMPNGYVCYAPPADAPPVGPLPALDHRYVTFGCFNNPAKITPQVIEVWCRILHRLPDARLMLKYRGFNDRGVIHRFGELFLGRGIDPDRVQFHGRSPHADMLAGYNRIDLALDPFPYSGGLTTCEALWMGVPVITCPFETFASRHSLSHLSNVGLTETIARDLDEYVGLAVKLAEDLPRLARTRARLRKRMAASPLCDGRRFVDDLMRVLHDAYAC